MTMTRKKKEKKREEIICLKDGKEKIKTRGGKKKEGSSHDMLCVYCVAVGLGRK
jgi:hypothetical protein